MIPAADGDAARAHSETGRADAVLAAVTLPRLSGYDLCRHGKKLDPTVPVVLLFDKGEPRQASRLWQPGGEKFLVPPPKQSQYLYAARDGLWPAHLLEAR